MQTHGPSPVDALFGQGKRAVIGLLFSNPDRELHLREIARLAGMSAPTIQREVNTLAEAGIINEKRLSNHRLFSANKESALFPWLQGLATLSVGIVDRLRDALLPIEGIEIAFVFGSVARGTTKATSDVDLMVVGTDVYLPVLEALEKIEPLIGRKVNPQVYSAAEVRSGLVDGNHFLETVWREEKLPVIGDRKKIDGLKP